MICRCPNLGNCTKADDRVDIDIPNGADAMCPECGNLLLVKSTGKKKLPTGIIVAGAVAFIVLGLGTCRIMRRTPPPPPVTPTPTLSPRPASPSPNQTPKAEVPPPTATPTAQVTSVLRLHGSVTVAETLIPTLVEAFLAQEHAANIKKIVGTMRGAATIQGTFPGDPVAKAIEIVPEKSKDALTDLAAKKCDVALASMKVNDQQARTLREAGAGDMNSKECEHIVALDALAIVLHPSNPVTEITKEQLAGIFGGQITDWGQLKGSSGRINVYHEPDESEDSESFRSLVFSGVTAPGAGKTVGDANAVSDSVFSDPEGIGYVELPAIGNDKVVAVSSGGALALLPNQFEIATEDYVLSRRLYLYTAASSPNEWVGRFVNFALSKAGQEVVETTRFVAMRPRISKRKIPTDAPVQYKSLTSNSERLDLNFRFRTGSDQLDNKALLDLGRVVELLRNPAYQGRYILLFGFTDGTGPAYLHPKLSQARAETVATELRKNGIKPAVVTGFGEKIPVDSNDTEQGREKNRRVEVWLRQ